MSPQPHCCGLKLHVGWSPTSSWKPDLWVRSSFLSSSIFSHFCTDHFPIRPGCYFWGIWTLRIFAPFVSSEWYAPCEASGWFGWFTTLVLWGRSCLLVNTCRKWKTKRCNLGTSPDTFAGKGWENKEVKWPSVLLLHPRHRWDNPRIGKLINQISNTLRFSLDNPPSELGQSSKRCLVVNNVQLVPGMLGFHRALRRKVTAWCFPCHGVHDYSRNDVRITLHDLKSVSTFGQRTCGQKSELCIAVVCL